jgi:hypothetical protein
MWERPQTSPTGVALKKPVEVPESEWFILYGARVLWAQERIGNMQNTTRKARSNNSRSDRLVSLASVVGALMLAISILDRGGTRPGRNRSNLANEGMANVLP